MNEGLQAVTTIIAAIIGLAIVAVIVSNNANTSGVLTSGGTALAGVIQAAVSPVASTASNPLLSTTSGFNGLQTLVG